VYYFLYQFYYKKRKGKEFANNYVICVVFVVPSK